MADHTKSDEADLNQDPNFWNWIRERAEKAKQDIGPQPIELTLDIPLSSPSSSSDVGSVEITNIYDISHETDFEVRSGVVFEF